MLAFKQGDEETSHAFFRRAIELKPSDGSAYVNLGLWELEFGDAIKALELLEKAFNLSPTDSHVHSTYHSVISEIGAFDQVVTQFQFASMENPNHKGLAYIYIDILIQLGNDEAVIGAIESAITNFGIDDGILVPALNIRDRLGPLEMVQSQTAGTSVSLCMIVKNEEENLAKCLFSAKPLVDEIIVVDTGSTDRTLEIAQVFGAKTLSFEWLDDFAAARNYSIDRAHGDWVFILDADETVSARDLEVLSNTIQDCQQTGCACAFVTRNYTDDVGTEGWRANDGTYKEDEAGSGWSPSEKVRLFPNHKRIRFENSVHELVEPSLRRSGIEMKKCEVPIHHYGTMNSDKTTRKKINYYELGKKKLTDMDAELPALIECAVQAAEVGEYSEAVSLWRHVIKARPKLPVAYFNLSFAYIQLEQYDAGLEAAYKAMELDSTLNEAVLNYALCLLRLGNHQMAIDHLEPFLIQSPAHPMATGLLGVAHCIRGNAGKGIELFDEVNQMGYNCAEYILEHARKLVSAGRVQHAASLLECASTSCHVNREIRTLLADVTDSKLKLPV